MKRADSNFISHGLKCAGWLYLPEGVEKPPIIIMGHGVAAERSFALPAFAERFVAQGWAVYLFDYRNIGDSEGTPRNLVSHWRHAQDWDAALDHVRALKEVDVSRIILWGSSYGGGHVIAAGARHRDICAIIAQVPFVHSLSSMRAVGIRTCLRGAMAMIWDGVKTLFNREPHTIPVVARPGTFAAMNTPESYDGYMSIVPKGSSWENKMPARFFLSVSLFSPFKLAGQVRCPALLLAAKKDSLVPIKKVRATAQRIPQGKFIELNANHFQPYSGREFETNITYQIAFIKNIFRV